MSPPSAQTPPSAQILGPLNQANTLLMQRRPADAAAMLRPLVARFPNVVEARRLFGLALRESGDLIGAELEFREGLAREQRADLFEALATTLERGGLRGEAEQAYWDALALDPLLPLAAIGLSELLLNENRPAEALAVIAPLSARFDTDLNVLSAYALALKALRRFDESIAVYRRAVTAAPRSAVAEHNLAAALGDAEFLTEAETVARRAFAKGLDAPETWLLLGRALQGQRRFDEAEQAYRQAIGRRPDYADAQAELAQLIWMRTAQIQAAGESLTGAIRAHPADVRLKSAKARLLEYAGEREAAYAELTEAIRWSQSDPSLQVQASHLAAWSDPERALAHADRALALAPNALDAQVALCLANLAAGRAETAAMQAGLLRERAPLDQHAVALQATAWRLLGDARYGQLYDYEGLVRSWVIDTPPGWPNLESFLSDLAARLEPLHALRTHPVGQSLRQGTQTQQRLDRSEDPVIRAFFQAVDGPIRRHIEAVGAGADPLRSRNTGGYRIEGAWSARLRPNGYHADHLHARGWLSSACHIAVPGAVEREREGWLRFGRPGVPTGLDLEPESFKKPRPGTLILFPSYMWHGTAPFSGDEPRLTIAFDLLPA